MREIETGFRFIHRIPETSNASLAQQVLIILVSL